MSPFRLNLLYIILKIPAILIAFTVQGYAKALVADKLGDKTPRFQGRLTLNPAAHIDLIGFIMILLAGFGWTKPLNTNPSAYKRRYKDAIKVSIAAPLANLLVGFIGMILVVFTSKFLSYILPETIFFILFNMLKFVSSINISLFVFNLLPFPALDGGWTVILLIELITRRKVPDKVVGAANYVGFMILIGFMIVVTLKDILFPISL